MISRGGFAGAGPLLAAAALALPLALAGGGCRGKDRPEILSPGGPPIRVQVLTDQAGQLILSAPEAVRLSTVPDDLLRTELSLGDRTVVLSEGEGFRLAGQQYPSPIRLVPVGPGGISVRAPGLAGSGRSYRGFLDLFNLGGKIRAINEVSLEEYVAGVVAGEMPADFPRAALECQAVVSRTYALYNLVLRGKGPLHQGFDGTASFQAYAGRSGETDAIRQAVQATAGWVLTYRGKVFPSYFHSTCGGNTTSAAWVFGDEEIPPLRGVPCDGCGWSSSHRWKLALTLRQVEGLLKGWAEENKIAMGELKGLSGVEPLPGGYLRYVKVVHGGGSFEMRADVFRRVLNRGGLGLKSTSFEVSEGPSPGTIVLEGRGFGHGVGMCQYGAGWKGRSMDFGRILAHYYPDSELKKVY